MRKIYIIRHCEKMRTGKGRFVSRTDVPLSAVGLEQGEVLRKWAQNQTFAHIFTSPMKRCLETAEFVRGLKEAEIVPELIELSLGEWEGVQFSEIKEKWTKEYEERETHIGTAVPPGGESFAQGGERLDGVVRSLLHETEGTLLIVAHAGILRGWLAKIAQISPDRVFEFELPYGSVTEVNWDGRAFSIEKIGEKPAEVPGRQETESFFRECATPHEVKEHGKMVAEKAMRLSEGLAVQKELLYVSALLHDMCKAEGKEHSQKAAQILRKAGYEKLAQIVEVHHDLPQQDSNTAEALYATEAELLYLADKYIKGATEVTLEERFAASRKKCGNDAAALAAWQKRFNTAKELEEKFIGKEEVRCEKRNMGNEMAGLILAAGLSSRMGDYKPLIEIDGRSMIGHVIDTMRYAGIQKIVVITGYRQEELREHLKEEGVTFVHNPDYATTQQMDSLKLGISALKGQYRRIMISPADVPLIEEKTVDMLLRQEGDFIRPLFRGEPGHPVLLNAEWIDYLIAYDGPAGLRGAVECNTQMRLVNVEVPDKGVILDNDTKEDLEHLLQWKRECHDVAVQKHF